MAAYCNDQYLIIFTTMAPSKTPYLNDQRNPPGSSSGRRGAGDVCVTRMSSVTSQSQMYKIPLNPTALTTPSPTNNVGAFDYAGDSNIAAPGSTSTTAVVGNGKAYMVDTVNGLSYGLDTRGPVGVAVDGQEIYPIWNNRGTHNVEECNVDACNQHVGAGGGQPHLHGDPFSSTDGVCLYGPGVKTAYSMPAEIPFAAAASVVAEVT